MFTWLGAHPKIVAVALICLTVGLIAALFIGADVMVFFRWVGDMLGVE